MTAEATAAALDEVYKALDRKVSAAGMGRCADCEHRDRAWYCKQLADVLHVAGELWVPGDFGCVRFHKKA